VCSKPVRDEEAHARDWFDEYLRECDPARETTWSRPNRDPPDLWVEIDGETFAVEVTGLFDRITDGDGKIRTNAERTRICQKLVDAAKQEARACEPCVEGYYDVHFSELPADSRSERKATKEWLARKFITTRHEQCTGWLEYIPENLHSPLLTLQKLEHGCFEVKALQPAFGKWDLGCQQDAICVANQALSGKVRKLSEGDVPKPWILLLVLQGPSLHKPYLREAIEAHDAADEFYSIGLITRDACIRMYGEAWAR